MQIPKPLVSVALCTFNGAGYIEEQLESLVFQTYKNLEIVVVDDKSSDQTYNVIKKYRKKFDNIRLYRNEINLGYSQNFEKAIGLCRGEYIALCDQDDVWDLRKIDRLVQNISTNVLIYHDSQFIDESGNLLKKKLSDVVNFYSGDYPEAFIFFNCISSHSLLFRKELTEYLFPFPEAGFHDAWIGYVACNLGRINFLQEVLVFYRQHYDSATDILKLKGRTQKKSKTVKYQETLKFIKKCKELPINKNPDIVLSLYNLYKDRTGKIFYFPLMLFFISNFNRFFVIYKKGLMSKINFAIKESRGVTRK